MALRVHKKIEESLQLAIYTFFMLYFKTGGSAQKSEGENM